MIEMCINILLIEDNPGDAEIILELLPDASKEKYQVKILERLSESIDYASEHQVDLALLDLGLPDSSGIETLIKFKEQLPYLPVVVITGNQDEMLGIEAVRCGAQDYILKGIQPDYNLQRVIRYAIERHQSEARLMASEQKYRSIINNIGVGVVLIDRQTRILEFNGLISKWFPDIQAGKSLKCSEAFACMCQANREESDCPVLKAFSDGKVHKQNKRKGKRTFSLIASPLKDEKGMVNHVVLLKEDISERLALENQLRQAQKMESLGTLAGGVAHDFNNILTAIIGFATLAKNEAPKEGLFKEDISEIEQAASRAAELVNQILTFSRMTETQKNPIRVDLIVKEALKLLSSTIPKDIEIINKVEKVTDLVLADPTQIHQIIMNLCTNASAAMEEAGGVMTIALQKVELLEKDVRELHTIPPGYYLKLEVSDTGSGIAPDLLESIFDPYFTTKEIGQGTGLGLSVVKGIIHEYGGHIHVDSALEKGTCFSLYFPILKKKIDVQEKSVDSQVEIGSESILFVDDEPSLLKLARRMLCKYGYRIHTEENGVKALTHFQNNQDSVDIIITDLTMPKMSGLELAKQIRLMNHDIPVIIITGYAKQLSNQVCKDVGIQAVHKKPLDGMSLARQIRELLDTGGSDK